MNQDYMKDNELGTSNTYIEMVPQLNLPELHRQLAALTNSHIHRDLGGMSEVERRAAIADIMEQIEQMLAFKRMPWEAVLQKAIRRANGGFSGDGNGSYS